MLKSKNFLLLSLLILSFGTMGYISDVATSSSVHAVYQQLTGTTPVTVISASAAYYNQIKFLLVGNESNTQGNLIVRSGGTTLIKQPCATNGGGFCIPTSVFPAGINQNINIISDTSAVTLDVSMQFIQTTQ